MKDKLRQYIHSGHKQVDGWLTRTAMALTIQLARIQKGLGIKGPVCEIGVHHGRYFILLHLLTTMPELAVAWDLFERWNENVDQSGMGDRQKLHANLQRHYCDLSRIRVVTANSLDLSLEDVRETCESTPRIFSIDGGHTAEVTCHDLSLAARSLQENGLIILDDFFNESWPGVAEGTCRYFADPVVRLYPVVIGGNKFVFTTGREAAREYREQLALPHGLYGRKKSMVFGEDVIVFTPYGLTLTRRLLHTAPALALRNSAIGRTARVTV